MGSKQSGTQTVQEKSDPWAGAQGYLSGGSTSGPGVVAGLSDENRRLYEKHQSGEEMNWFEQAMFDKHVKPKLSQISGPGSGRQAIGILPEAEALYRRSTANPFNSDERAAMSAMRARGDRDYSLVNTGLDTLQRTARGDFVGQQNFMDAYGEGILNEVNSRFAQANRTGSGYAAQAAAKGLTQGAAPLYAQERALQQQAALAAPGYQSAQYGLLNSDIEALMQVGRMRRNRPYENLENYANIVLPASGMGGTSATDTPFYTNPMAGAAGGAMAGGQMFGPWGAVAGGALGYLSSR